MVEHHRKHLRRALTLTAEALNYKCLRLDAKAETFHWLQSVNLVLLNCNDTLNMQRLGQRCGTKGRFCPHCHTGRPTGRLTL